MAGDHSASTVPLLINGEEVTSAITFPVIGPVSYQKIWSASSANVELANAAVEAAQSAFPIWSATKPAWRRDIFFKAADILEARCAEVSSFIEAEIGAEPSFGAGFTVPLSIELLRDVAGRIASAMDGAVPITAQEDRSAMILKEPYGVILGIVPWNAPVNLGFRAVAYAIAAGNTCILKGSELSPRCFWAIGRVFTDAGLPPGVLNVLFHRYEDAAEVTSFLIKHPHVKKINFTGSPRMGRIIAEQAGRALKPCLMELGGKSPALILADADLREAAKAVAIGAFMHSGQICMSTERIIVESAIVEPFTVELKAIIEKMWPKHADAAILINKAAVEKNKRLVREAVADGAEILTGEIDIASTGQGGNRMQPIVLKDVKDEMQIYHAESFGPTVSLLTVSNEAEAVRVANSSEYGLSASVFTRDLKKGLALAKKLESGAVHINAMTVHDEVGLPHGGVKISGWGRFNSGAGFEEFLKTKTVTWLG